MFAATEVDVELVDASVVKEHKIVAPCRLRIEADLSRFVSELYTETKSLEGSLDEVISFPNLPKCQHR